MKMRVLWNSVSSTGVFAVNVALSLIMAPFYLHELGQAGYGFFELILGLLGYLNVLELGSGPALVQFIAVAQGRRDYEEVNRVFAAGLVILTAVGVVGALLMGGVAIDPALVFGAHNIHSLPELRTALLLFGLNFLATWMRSALSCYLMGAQAYVTVNSVRIGVMIAQALANWLLLSAAAGYLLAIMAATAAAGSLIELAIFTGVIRKAHREVRFSFRVSFDTARRLFGFGAKSAVLIGASTFFRGGLLFVLAHTVGVAQIVYFSFPSRLVDYASTLWHAMSAPLEPYFAQAFGRGGVDATRGAWLVSTRGLQFVGFGMLLAVAWLGLPFLALWLGPQYAAGSRTVLFILCVALLMEVIATNAMRVLISTARHGRVALLSMMLGVVCLGVAYGVIRRTGIEGAAVAYLIFAVVQCSFITVLVCRFFGIPVAARLMDIARQFLLPLLVSSVGFYLARRLLVPNDAVSLVLNALMGGGAYVATSLVTVVTAEERRAIVDLVFRRRRPAGA